MSYLLRALLALAGLLLAAPASAQQPSADQQARIKQIQALMDSLHPQTGDVSIPGAEAVLHLGKDYYFLPAEEARKVLVEGWGNPPDTATDVLGIGFPAGKTFVDDTWGAVITWQATGYVSDEDAKTADYDELLKQMQSGEEEINAERAKQGYPAQHLVGWAQPPSYDPASHSVIWAQNFKFGDTPVNSLNYDVRLLGRRGVLSLNMLSEMPKLEETRKAAEKFAASVEFKPGARYADYQPGKDAKADFGVAGLVAAGVGVAAAKKLGLLAVILAFGKKFFILILALFAGLGAWINRRFLGGGDPPEEPQAYYEEMAEEPAPIDPARPGPGAGPDPAV